ncbi:MAG: ribosome small subunit-dependent GTPase A [Planktomarina temperata]|uniref:ribosome small subunit-dependent GTPase A n=1 Tax=Planktomarina TaxID=1284657 RepID=UPI0023035782|nr:ribosome small subunit-dependent GTPase A [Planktomarina temperata]MDP4060592.1 Small ribosomal subunit biogenesis GTPase RsgA [Rhodobacteraceae bacterium LE17]MDA8830883.1 ribosome small subunit-dependent GTPase A [Planktomarina temperata]MDA9011754.1 ribosome small subunit-dependent GTPase A [Planktomarina temperata]MDA9566688.1 ribosome small subunit-dependent GTPase A [Planktomarina temperata]
MSLPTQRDAAGQLRALGWSKYFADQATSAALSKTPPVRITQVHRNTLHIQGVDLDMIIPGLHGVTVGDWLLFDADTPRNSQLLSRKSLIKRRAPGHDRKEQLIAANLDTAFVVTSCNNDFSLARLERYVAMAHEAGVTPVIILSKIDLTTEASDFAAQAQSISPQLSVVCLDARSPEAIELLRPWCQAGQTVAFLGSSGVGKSTLTNSLAGNEAIATQDVRASDDKGRHTTTGRQLHILPSGCAVLDTPGMREIQLTDVSVGLEETFADLHALKQNCRFNDCAHKTEPGCAVQAAVASGEVDVPRLQRWLKLVAEDAENTKFLANRKLRDRAKNKPEKSVTKYDSKK